MAELTVDKSAVQPSFQLPQRRLRINVFGPGEVWLDNKLLDLDRREGKWVLFSLALEYGEPILRETFEKRFFPGGLHRKQSLCNSLSELEKRLGMDQSPIWRPARGCLQFNLDAADLDLREFDEAIANGELDKVNGFL